MTDKLRDYCIYTIGMIDAKEQIYNENSNIQKTMECLPAIPEGDDNELRIPKELSVRYKPNGRVELRYRKNGYEKSFSGATISEAAAKAQPFIKELNKAVTSYLKTNETKTVNFKEYAEEFVRIVKAPDLKPETMRGYRTRLNNHIYPYIGDKNITDIKNSDIQRIIHALKSKGIYRTLEDVNGILKQIFEYAEANKDITDNPMTFIKIKKHVRQTGKALSIEDERRFLGLIDNHPYQGLFLLLLYTGIRPCEIETVSFKNGFIKCENMKRKNNTKEYKVIPLTPMIEPYLDLIKQADLTVRPLTLSANFRKLMGGEYRLYDLRHTFITRVQTCGVPEQVVKLWAGHAPDRHNMTASVYTHFTEEFILSFGSNVKYNV